MNRTSIQNKATEFQKFSMSPHMDKTYQPRDISGIKPFDEMRDMRDNRDNLRKNLFKDNQFIERDKKELYDFPQSSNWPKDDRLNQMQHIEQLQMNQIDLMNMDKQSELSM